MKPSNHVYIMPDNKGCRGRVERMTEEPANARWALLLLCLWTAICWGIVGLVGWEMVQWFQGLGVLGKLANR